DVCSHTFCSNEYDECMLRSPLFTNYWARHGNVEIRGFYPISRSARSSNVILSASLEVKLELEIHPVSSVSLVGFKAHSALFIVISNQIGIHTLNVAYDS